MEKIDLGLLINSMDKEFFEATKTIISERYLKLFVDTNGQGSPAGTMLEILFNKNHIKKVNKEELVMLLNSFFSMVLNKDDCVSKYMRIISELFVDSNDNIIHNTTNKSASNYIKLFVNSFVNAGSVISSKGEEETLNYMEDFLKIVLAMYPYRKNIKTPDGKVIYAVTNANFDISEDDMKKLSEEIFSVNSKIEKKKSGLFKKQQMYSNMDLLFASFFSWLVFYRLAQNEGIEIGA